MNIENNIVQSGPTKDFFISMITRDIILEDAIIELIDNSIDGIKRLKVMENYSKYKIEVTMNNEYFEIADNCGGIDIEIARSYAFKFGRPSDIQETQKIETIGTFGIGMKRALFKMGKKFAIQSTFTNSKFLLNIDVDEWAAEENWDFKFSASDEDKHPEVDCGTKITIKKLYPGISIALTSNQFINELIRKVQSEASYEISKGLIININKTPVSKKFLSIVKDSNIKPYKYTFKNDSIKVIVIAGIANKTKPELAGWYIYCNGREIVSADKSNITTWDNKYHNDFAAFRGFVFFNSLKPELLPWNTSKTGIDTSSNIYQTIKPHMKSAFDTVTGELKKIYRDMEEEERGTMLAYISDRKAIDINYDSALKLRNNSVLKFVDSCKPLPKAEARISYSKPKSEVDAIKANIKNKSKKPISNKEVGSITFDYYCDMEGIK